MEDNTLNIIFHVLDLKESNNYSSIKFETLFKEIFPITSNVFKINVDVSMINNRKGTYDEIIYLIPSNKEFKEKKYIITLNCDCDTIVNININKEGNCSLEIASMWHVNQNDNINITEREIPDIKYSGEILKFEKLYERKRWNILNAKIEDFGDDLFSNKTIDYITNNKEKSFKYDIILNDESKFKFLNEKKEPKNVEFLTGTKKDELKKLLESSISELVKKINGIIGQTSKEFIYNESQVDDFKSFLGKSKSTLKYLEDIFNIYNGKWDLEHFSSKDFDLFMLFSELQIHHKEIDKDYRETLFKKYEEFKNQIISNKNLNLIEKTRIICSFSRFCNKLLLSHNYPEFVLINELEDDNSYKMAVENYKNIISELKESSGFFKILLLFDMGSSEIINEWDLQDYDINNLLYIKSNDQMSYITSKFGEFKLNIAEINRKKKSDEKIIKITFPVLSMLTLNQIKNHLFDLVPKFLFRVHYKYDFKAVSDVSNHISYFNDSEILHLEILEKKLININQKEYILPLTIEISHETYSHIKIRYSNSNCESPLLNPIRGKNKLLCPNFDNTESGYVMEYFFVDNYEELKFMKTPNSELIPLLDQKYWTDINFNKMKEFNKIEMKKRKLQKKQFDEDYENMLLYDKRNHAEGSRINCVF